DVATGVPATVQARIARQGGYHPGRRRRARTYALIPLIRLIPLQLHEDTAAIEHPEYAEPHEDEGNGEQQRGIARLEPRGVERLGNTCFGADLLSRRVETE